MHSPSLKRSVTAPHNPVPSITITAKTLGSYTPRSLYRHRSASPNPQSRTRSPDSPRPLDLLCHKSVPLGRSSPHSYPHSHSPTTPETGTSSQSSGLHVLVREELDSGLHVQAPEVTDTVISGLHAPIPEESEAGSSTLGRVYESAWTSPDSSEVLYTPPILVDHDHLGILQQPDYRPNISSQSCLSFYAPPAFDTERTESENLRLGRLVLTEREKSVVQDTPLGYSTTQAKRVSRSVPEGNTPDLQFPILVTPNLRFPVLATSGALDLSIKPGDFKRKPVIGDPDPSFHRSLNSPVRGEPPDQVVVEQVGSFGVHHLRNDSLGELPYISTIEALPISPPQPSSEEPSPGGTPEPGLLNKPEAVATPAAVIVGGEVTPSIVVLPGEYIRRRHSGSALRSQGHRDFGVNIQIIEHVPSQYPEIVAEARVTSDRPPNTPESPFTLISREQTKVKGRVQNSSSLITFLSAVSPIQPHYDEARRPKPPGKENPNGILPAVSSGTTVICFVNAYGDQHIFLPEMDVPINALLPHIAELTRESSPCLKSVRRIIERDDQTILSPNN